MRTVVKPNQVNYRRHEAKKYFKNSVLNIKYGPLNLATCPKARRAQVSKAGQDMLAAAG
jgi:hypothetical protein